MKMSLPKSVSKIINPLLNNKYVLYIVAFISLLVVFGYMVMGNLNAVIFFLLVAYLTRCFSGNMIVVLLVPLFLTNVLVAGFKIKEGLDNMNKDDNLKKDANKKNMQTHSSDDKINPIVPGYVEKSEDDADVGQKDTDDNSGKQDESFRPIEYSSVKGGNKKVARLDHGATVENAYDTLNKIIGGPGFAKMTDDTKRLMEQQQKLAQSIEQFGPMIDSIKPFLEKAQGLLGKLDLQGIAQVANKPVASA
jgi:uncharacterized membrane protein YciS (DUF1049 family)